MTPTIQRVAIIESADGNRGTERCRRNHLLCAAVAYGTDNGDAAGAGFFDQFVERAQCAIGRKIAADGKIDDAYVVAMLIVNDPVERAINVVFANTMPAPVARFTRTNFASVAMPRYCPSDK